jgi:hypothetical protein
MIYGHIKIIAGAVRHSTPVSGLKVRILPTASEGLKTEASCLFEVNLRWENHESKILCESFVLFVNFVVISRRRLH